MKLLIAFAIALVVAVLGAISFAYTGLYNVSARAPDSDIANWLMSTTSHASIARRADDIEVPNLDDQDLVGAGANDFSAMCAGCHGAPGQRPEAVGQGLNPSPPDLTESAEHMTPAELFWVTKNGIKMTGMPAWGATHEDDALWPVVAFMTTLPDLDASGYQVLLSSAKGAGHHASGDDESHSHGTAESAPSLHDHARQETTEHAEHAEAPDVGTGAHGHGTDDDAPPTPAADEEAHDDEHDHSH